MRYGARTEVYFPTKDDESKYKQVATERGMSFSSLVRLALDAYIQQPAN